MAKDKYDFIEDILSNKKLSPTQKERVLLLTKKEIEKDKFLGRRLEKRVKILEESIEYPHQANNNDRTPTKDTKNGTKDISKPHEYIYPYNLYRYLFDYNQNPILKSTCHEIDSNELENIKQYCGTEEYVFEEHLNKIIEAFEEHNEIFAPRLVKALVRGYLTGKRWKGERLKGWSSNKISWNWSSEELMKWSKQNQGVPPNLDEGLMNQMERTGFEFDKSIKLSIGDSLQSFSNLVIHFKHLFHIRADNSLRNIIIDYNKSKKYKESIDFEMAEKDFPNNIEFFTDVDKLLQAYDKIIKLIIEQIEYKETNKEKNTVKLTLKEIDNGVEFSILHRESIYAKTIRNTKERLGNTYRELINKQINGMCNFYVQADFEDRKSYRIGIWNKPGIWEKSEPEIKELYETVGGVEHIFEFITNDVK